MFSRKQKRQKKTRKGNEETICVVTHRQRGNHIIINEICHYSRYLSYYKKLNEFQQKNKYIITILETISLQNNRHFMQCIYYIYTILFFDSFFRICFIPAMKNKYSKWLSHVIFTLLKQTGSGYA